VILRIRIILLADCQTIEMIASLSLMLRVCDVEVLVQPLNRILRVEPGANLLQALQAAQIPMSYSCMAGRCGTCRCRVLGGEVLDHGSEQQRPLDGDGSYVLACQTYITEPCTIEIPEPDEVVVHPARIIKATVLGIEELTHDIRRLVLLPIKPIEFSPGQYAQIQFTPGHIRPYSMAGLSTDQHMEFHVRLIPDGRVSSYLARTLKIGASVKLSGPLGSAYLRHKHTGPMLCVAGATGLAPILSIIRGAIAARMQNPIHLYFGVRTPRDIYGVEWLESLKKAYPNLKVHFVVASGGDSRMQRCGVVTEVIEQDLRELDGWRAYVCGSPPMVEAATALVRRMGLTVDHIYADAFYPQAT
jgi:ferredoxin-NAD(P)+ reductase (naphthalene dioxygenase ferredoxin-specific)